MQAAARSLDDGFEAGLYNSDTGALWMLNWKELDLPYCGVYVISTDSLLPCKVGFSVSPMKRLAAIQTSHWRKLQVSAYRWCETQAEARKIEQEAHNILRDKKSELLGEWFDARVTEALDAIEWASVTLSIPVHKHVPQDNWVKLRLEELKIAYGY